MDLPKDINGRLVPLAPYKAIAVTLNTTLSTTAAPIVTLNALTKFLRIKPTWQDILIKFTNWTGAVTDADFDEHIRDGETFDAFELETFKTKGWTTISAKTIAWTGAVTRLSVKES